MAADDDLIREFLLETREILNQLDQDFVALEKAPGDRARLQAIFRGVHTVKGTSGFIPLERLQALAHAGESLLSLLRDGELAVSADIISALLSMVDAIRAMVNEVEVTGSDGEEAYAPLIARLEALASAPATGPNPLTEAQVSAPAPSAPIAAAPVPVAAPPPTAPTPPAPLAAVPTPPPASAPVPAPTAPEPARAPPVLAVVPAAAPSAPTAEPSDGAGKAPAGGDTTVRVDVGLLDRVMSLVGELVLARNQIIQYGQTVKNAGFADASQRLNLLTTELHESVMKTRMQPIGTVWSKFPRVARDLALACGKRVELSMEGEDTELDRTIIEAIKDPLTHAVRNAIDHGIEAPELRLASGKAEVGRLLLRAFHEGGQVNVEISDDGAGLDVERIRTKALERKLVTPERAARMSERELVHLIFLPGFSTAAAVTNVSGRGVGMDVVKTNIERIGGTVDVQSTRGRGTTLKIKLPLTLAIVPALIVTSGADRFAIPQVNLLELVRLEGEQVKKAVEQIHGAYTYRLRGNLLPLVFLDQALKLGQRDGLPEAFNIIVLQADERQFGLVVDAVHDTEEIVVKPLGKSLKGIREFSGATIMGDGRVALILDVLGLAQRSNVVSATERQRAVAAQAAQAVARQEHRESMLSFEVSGGSRLAVPLARVARLEEIAATKVERASGREVVQYRGEIMPLIDLGRVLGTGGVERGLAPLQVVVFTERGKSVGMVVERILDVAEEAFQVTGTPSDLVRGSTVLQGKVTDLLDVQGVIRQCEPSFFESALAA